MTSMVLVAMLVFITVCFPHSGKAAIEGKITVYNAAGEMDIRNPFTLGTRVLLIFNVTGFPEGSEIVSYRWFHSRTGTNRDRYQIRKSDSYYRVVDDTLLMDVTSVDQRGKYYCFVKFRDIPETGRSTSLINVAGNPAPFLYTPTSLLPEHSVLTDVQQATGRNGQQWITCRSGGEGTRPEIWMGSELVVNSSTANSATIGLGTQHPNGLYHCLSEQSQREYFSLYLRSSGILATPTLSGRDTSTWTITSPDGSRVERYIVEFDCRVRSITFVEKYMSVSASGGTGRVATSVSCFGGIGQLYRVKVWAVSGPNISPALVCVTDGQCIAEETFSRGTPTIPTPRASRESPTVQPTNTMAVKVTTVTSTTLTTAEDSRGSATPSTTAKAVVTVTTVIPTTSTVEVSTGSPTPSATVTTPPGNTDTVPVTGRRISPTITTAVNPPPPNTDMPLLTPMGTPDSTSEHATMQSNDAWKCIPSMVVPVSAGALTFLVGIATFIAGVVMLVRAKRVLHHSTQPPPPETDHYAMVDEGVKRARHGAGMYEEVERQNTQTGRLAKIYQELDVTKMQRSEYASIKV